jgi:hypothetical protein
VEAFQQKKNSDIDQGASARRLNSLYKPNGLKKTYYYYTTIQVVVITSSIVCVLDTQWHTRSRQPKV